MCLLLENYNCAKSVRKQGLKTSSLVSKFTVVHTKVNHFNRHALNINFIVIYNNAS